MPEVSFTMYICQYPCNPIGINNDHNLGKGNQKKSEVIWKKLFYKMKKKRQEKNSARELLSFMNCNLHLYVW